MPEVTAGIPYPAGPLDLVVAELDPSVRRRLALHGETLTPEFAKAAGVVDVLVPEDQITERAVETALQLARAPGYAAVKHQLRAPTLDRMRKHIETVDPIVALLLAQRKGRD